LIFVYLHGFASSPRSAKAEYFQTCFRSRQIDLQVPDLNQPNFSQLTLTRQIQQVQACIAAANPEDQPVTVIGSSFGGLTAAWVAEQCSQVQCLVLLAPAFQFLSHWQARLGREQLQQWQQTGSMAVYHYGAGQMLPLDYSFVVDLGSYEDAKLQRSIPTLILHGSQDEVIPVQASRDYGATRPWVQLIELPSDHALTDVTTELWQQVQTFCCL
jgi:hypothetical protein